ncbi:hypothetical protein FOQG_19605 [Fusarium oxysporum f. sp. raphani 54005]|uniref:Uncharacterized protein n=1 Tax=Fusarium oxysporum f. sp. raphani 54005 TaxID=1089458 RepID=X0B9Y0_FUSOX|nr:hypothetical protein FOQG_19605 [Fusarium oxysporum f. sp. raphani 54005]
MGIKSHRKSMPIIFAVFLQDSLKALQVRNSPSRPVKLYFLECHQEVAERHLSRAIPTPTTLAYLTTLESMTLHSPP